MRGWSRIRRARLVALAIGFALALPASPSTADEPELEFTGMTFVGSREGQTDLLLQAAHARYEPDQHIVFLTQMEVEARGEDGSKSLSMTSDSGRLLLESNDFHASGNVRGTTGDGRVFRTEWVEYDREEGLVRTDAPVEIDDESVRLRGGGFRYKVDREHLRLIGGAQVIGR